MSILLIKLLLAPGMILLVSLACRRWGPVLGGLLAGLPIVAGPVILVLGLEQGGEFGRAAAQGALSGVLSLGLFCFCYAWMSLRFAVPLAIVAGWSAFFVSTCFFLTFSLDASLMFPAVLLGIGSLLANLPPVEPLEQIPSISATEIAVRMIAACLLVLLISILASHLGPHLSGLLAPFPIAGTVLSAFTHRFQGGNAVITLLRGFTRGLLGMATFCYVIIISEPAIGFAASVTLGAVLAVIVAGAVAAFGRSIFRSSVTQQITPS